ncbi:MAG: sulfatase-like hydrolase/transferase [Verrucomicrobiota bacterium]
MKQIRRHLMLAWLAAVMACGTGFAAEPKPNVILIMADDLGSVDLGCYGSKDLVTPAMDSLAARGLRFTQFYAGAPICSASRACLLTGRYPLHAGLTANASSQRGGKAALPAAQVTLAEMFKAAGYATAQIGKWHLGYTEETLPNAQGFDYSFGHMGGCIDNYTHMFSWKGPVVHDLHRNGKEVFYDGEYFPDLMLREASGFLERRSRDQPFFLYYAVNTPHYPYQGEAKWLEHFKDMPEPRRFYAAWLASQDERIGQLLAKVDALGLRERTIIVFQSDNGHSTEDRAYYGGGSAGPYRGAKFSLFEGGIRMPAMISWPGQLPQGEVRGQFAHAADWMPTLAELCGVSLLETNIDGYSLVPVLRSAEAQSPRNIAQWQESPGPHSQWAVREGNWKLLGHPRDTSDGKHTVTVAPLFLANLAEDPGEKTNVADQHADVVQRLKQLHNDWFKQTKSGSAPQRSDEDPAL